MRIDPPARRSSESLPFFETHSQRSSLGRRVIFPGPSTAAKSVICTTTNPRHTHAVHLMGLVASKHARSHCITTHWRSNPQDCNTLDQQDTKTANPRASFPSAAGTPLRPITFDVTACHATRYRTLRCCLRDCVSRPLTCCSSPQMNGLSCPSPIASCSYLPRMHFRAVIL